MKKRALHIGTIAGVDLYIHWTFSLLIVGVPAFYLLTGSPAFEAFFVLALLIAIFVCVVLHEFGHALVARRYEVPTSDITLYPIGGVARLQRVPTQPMHEFWIAVAGPAVNVVIAAILLVGILVFGGLPPLQQVMMEPGTHFWTKLLGVNLVLVGFNLLPAFPMDGGRVMRALLATRMNYLAATRIAARTGQGMAILFGVLGFMVFNPILMFIALFVFLGAQQENQAATMRTVIQGVPISEGMITRFETLSREATLSEAIEKLLQGSDHEFPVVEDEDRPVGVLTRRDLMRALKVENPSVSVGDIMRTSYPLVDESKMLDEAFQQMQETQCPIALVTRDDRLVGIQTMDNVGEYVMISTLLSEKADSSDADSEIEGRDLPVMPSSVGQKPQ